MKNMEEGNMRKLILQDGLLLYGSIDGAGPANMSRDLPYKKSQLDLKPFGVGVPTMGSTVVHIDKYDTFFGSKCVTLQ